MQPSSPSISVVFPVYNEAGNLPELIQRATTACSQCTECYELLFVDDGSRDQSAAILAVAASRDKNIKVVLLARNFKQHAAIAAAFNYAIGDIVIMMDADLQDFPEDIPKFLEKCAEGYDIVYGIREKRQDPLYRKLGAQLYFTLFEKLSGYPLPRGVATYRALTRRAVDAFNQLPEHDRFTAGMMAWLGFPVGNVPIQHAPRTRGKSNYNTLKLFALALDGLVSSSEQPLRFASVTGLFLAAVSFAMGIDIIYRRLVFGFDIIGYASIIATLFFLGGIQVFFMGIIGEYLARVFKNTQGRPIYIVKNTLNIDDLSD